MDQNILTQISYTGVILDIGDYTLKVSYYFLFLSVANVASICHVCDIDYKKKAILWK